MATKKATKAKAKKVYCLECGAKTEPECICDDLNFDEYCPTCGRESCHCDCCGVHNMA